MSKRVWFVVCSGLFSAILLSGFNRFALAQTGEFTRAACNQNKVNQNGSCAKIPNLSGSYTGSLTDADSGAGTITLSIQQKGTHITGIWGTSYPNGESNGGTLTGTVSKKAARVKLTTPLPRCFYTVLVSIGTDSLQGTFVDSRHCPEEDSGSFTLPYSQQ